MMKRIWLCLLLLVIPVSLAHAAEVKCSCPVAMRALLGELAPQFERASGHKVTLDFATIGAITDRVRKGDPTDVAIVSAKQSEAEVQNYTVYVAGIAASRKHAEAAKVLITFLSSSAAKQAMKAKGFEPR